MPNLSDLLDSDVEVVGDFIDENSLISSVSDTTSIAQAKSTTARRKRKPVTMPKKSRAKSVVQSTSEAAPKPVSAKRKMEVRAVDEDDTETVESLTTKTKANPEKSTKSKESKGVAKKGKSAKKELVQEDVEVSEHDLSTVFAHSNFAQTKSTKPLPKPVKEGQTKAVTKKSRKQPAAVEEVASDEDKNDDIEQQEPPKKKARTENRRPQEPSYRRRAASVSDTERGDPMLRRKLGDVTRKYENVDIKYRSLKEVAITEATTNVERLRKQCEAISEASNKLITSLKKELALQAPLVQEARKLKKDSQGHDIETEKLRTANKDLSTSLAAAQTEIKNLQAKLAAVRTAPPETKIPSSTAKQNTIARAAASATSESAQIAQLKLDLYGDLTGLIIRNVKMEKDGDTYDCIQTGRNGSKYNHSMAYCGTDQTLALHFKLYIDHEEAKNLSFEEVEFLYTPLLDTNRDRDLIEIMPPYLSEDITFARENAAKFYARVVDTLTKKFEVVEEVTE